MTQFAPAQPHGPLRELFPDVYLAPGSFRMGPLLTISRNMVILRDGADLTLVNAVRLSPEGEAALQALGTVRHLVKLGHYHTLDDPYLLDRYSPTYWAPASPRMNPKAQPLTDGAPGPSARTSVFTFQATKEGEAALVVEQAGGNLLITCDSVQHWPDTTGCSFVGGLVVRQMGFMRERAKLGPIWMKEQTGGKPAALRPDFERLLARDFVHLISGHGALLRDDAKSELAQSCAKVLK